MQKFKFRQKARRYALQALYGWLINNNNLREIEEFYLTDRNPKKFDVEYFCRLLHKIPTMIADLDQLMRPFLDRPLADLNYIELIVLRIATYELQHELDIPYKVVINEALELEKTFGAEDGYKFVNGVLDKLARSLNRD